MALSEIGTASGSATSGSVTVTLSASPASGDIILIFVTFNNATSGSHPVPSISGFTSLGSSTASVWSRTHCLWKLATGSEGTSLSLTHTGDVGVFQVVTGLVIRGADSAQPTNIVTTADATSNTTVSIAAITTAANNSWDIVCAGYGGNNDYGSGASYSSWGTSLVEKADAQVFGGGAYYCGLGMAYVARVSAGAQSATTVTQTGTDVASVIRIEIKEASSGATSTAAGTFPSFTGAAVATQTQTATAAGTFPSFTGAAVGNMLPTSTAAGTFPSLTGAAVGIHGGDATSTAAGTFPSFTGAAVGTQTQTATAAGTFPSFTGAATGTQKQTSTAAGTFPSFTGAAVGTQQLSSTAAGTFPVFTGAAVAMMQPSGVGAGTFPSFTGAAVGTHPVVVVTPTVTRSITVDAIQADSLVANGVQSASLTADSIQTASVTADA